MVNQERLVENFLDMVKIPSASYKEREMADYLIKHLTEMGLEVEEDNAGELIGGNAGNIVAVLKAPGKKKVLFSAHMDTVLPCDKITPIMENGIIRSDETSVLGGDDKSGIAAIIEMVKMIKENNIDHPELILVFSVAEEVGLLGAKHFNIEKYGPDMVFVIDSGGAPGSAVIQTPFAAKGEIKVIGKTAHAGLAPELGINALLVASHAITKLRLGRIDKETTSNIGVVKGGQAVNIVMPEVVMEYEARSFNGAVLDEVLAETFQIFKSTTEEFNTTFTHTVEKSYPGYKLEDTHEILSLFEKGCIGANLEFKKVSSGGGCDANIYSGKGIPSLNMGIGMAKVHTNQEFIKIDDMVKCSHLIYEIVKGI